MNNYKFIIIGSNSFSGATFISYLLHKGHKVVGLSRSQEYNNVFLPYTWHKNNLGNFKFIKVDLNKNLDKLLDIINDEKPDCIVNFAALGMVAQSWKKPEDWYRTNLLSQVKFHDRIRHLDFIKKYIHVTTPEVYGSTDGWIKENFNFNPSTPYAVSRAACDLHLASFFEAYNFPVIFTRSANVYGPGQQLYRIIPRTILYARLGKKLHLDGGGTSDRSFIHMDDVSEATYLIAMKGELGETYHISTQETITIVDLVKKICDYIDIDFSDLVNISDERLGKDQSYRLESKKMRKQFEWKEKIDINEGIKLTVDWVDQNIDMLKDLPQNYIHIS